MKSGNRWAQAFGWRWSSALVLARRRQRKRMTWRRSSARIAELSRASKYSEAIPLAQGQLDSMEKKYGPVTAIVAAALNKSSAALWQPGSRRPCRAAVRASHRDPGKSLRPDFLRGCAGTEQSGRPVPATRTLCRCRAAVQAGAGDRQLCAATGWRSRSGPASRPIVAFSKPCCDSKPRDQGPALQQAGERHQGPRLE